MPRRPCRIRFCLRALNGGAVDVQGCTTDARAAWIVAPSSTLNAYHLQTSDGCFLSAAEGGGALMASQRRAGPAEAFKILTVMTRCGNPVVVIKTVDRIHPRYVTVDPQALTAHVSA